MHEIGRGFVAKRVLILVTIHRGKHEFMTVFVLVFCVPVRVFSKGVIPRAHPR